jgi:hypothetical protein
MSGHQGYEFASSHASCIGDSVCSRVHTSCQLPCFVDLYQQAASHAAGRHTMMRHASHPETCA